MASWTNIFFVDLWIIAVDPTTLKLHGLIQSGANADQRFMQFCHLLGTAALMLH